MAGKRSDVPFNASHFKKEATKGIRRSVQDTFTFIYNSNHWSGQRSISGNGSDFIQTETIRKQLPELILQIKIRTMLDLPCGDFNWMQTVDLKLDHYIGGDIVPELIEQNQKKYGNAKREFRVLDIIRDSLPTTDLIFCRDCFVHLSNEHILKALNNIKKSGTKYLLTTTFTECETNQDIITGDWRIIHLEKDPFCLPRPLLIISENCTEGNGTYADKSLGLWVVDDISL
jgi:SAM-dependent methyltransferase